MDVDEKILKSYLMDRTFDCPVCDNNFKNWAIKRSRLRLLGSGPDLRPQYTPVDPLYYDIIICPMCGYAAMLNSYKKISTSQILKVLEEITSRYTQREYPMIYTSNIALERYKLALLTSMTKGGKASEKAFICLKLSWIYSDIEDVKSEKKFLTFAFNNFEEAFQKENTPFFGMDSETLIYLMGYISYRLGNTKAALKYISEVIISTNNKRLKERSLELKEVIKGERDEADIHIN